MPNIDIQIHRVGDPPLWPDQAGVKPIHMRDSTWYLAGLERGMSSGRASIMVRLDLPNGQTVVAENSLQNLIMATLAMRGAFPDEFANTPLAVQADQTIHQRAWESFTDMLMNSVREEFDKQDLIVMFEAAFEKAVEQHGEG